ncbi:hypothetical protein [Colwellia psychrerythraea]|uniref:Uncharacterized protein n=1 Tax=Colwellia psychrerythraea TaxID=28229 RepID=A0A099L1V3_COLPS|nr:hypothetical protein [Colwellia psychrerythraea]KGJ96425.1 hypothetical protein GAB14E_0372 [Colwellia psychrerythraea]
MMKLTSVSIKPNTLKTYAKTKVALIGSALLLAFSAQGADKNYDNLSKQLNIMNDIMLSSAKAPQNSRQPLIRSIDSVYLQGQGAIFTVNSAHGGSSHRQFFQMVAPIAPVSRMPPVAPKGERVVTSDNDDFVIEFSDHDDEFERVIEVFEQQREGARELRSEEREIVYEMRDIARQRKDIEYQLQRAEKDAKKQLSAELKVLDVERASLSKNKASLDKKVAVLNKQREQQKVAQSNARTAHFSAVNNALVETLCLYGNGLRAIPSQEHVSLIIKGAGKKQSRGYKDQILVFNKKDINACANSKLTAKKLLTKAEQYQF